MAGIFLGFNNFMLGLISDLGINAAYLFSCGALFYTFTIRIYDILVLKYYTNVFWDIKDSNLIKINNQGKMKPNYINVLGLLIRTLLNLGFQISIILAFKYANKADINQGIITSLFSTYCVFTTAIFYFIFDEQLKTRFVIGIIFMLFCVVLIAYPDEKIMNKPLLIKK